MTTEARSREEVLGLFGRGGENGPEEWATPPSVFGPLNDEFAFDLDVCANAQNAKTFHYLSKEDDGLSWQWAPRRCWMNPPYGRVIGKWTAKAAMEARRGALVVGLLPARTETGWFHRDVFDEGAEVRFLRGRVKFIGVADKGHNAPFPSVVVIWRPKGAR